MKPATGVVDRAQVRALLVAYWRMAQRGPAANALAGGREQGHGLLVACLLYGVMGALTGAATLGSGPFLFGFVLHGFTLFAVGLALTVESGDVLFSGTESDVLGPHPVSPATLLLAKSVHLYAFGLVLALSINAVPVLLAPWVKGAKPWFLPAHLLAVMVLLAFACAAVVFVYGAVARLVGREKFESVITWAQVGTSIVFVVGLQLFPRMLQRVDGSPLPGTLLLLSPPGWFAALGSLLGGAGGPECLLPASVGVCLTATLAWSAVRKLSGGYAEVLAASAPAWARGRGSGRSRGPGRPGFLVRFWLANPVQHAAYSLAVAYMARDRETKQRLYPSLASLLVVPLMTLVDSGRGRFSSAFFCLLGLGMVALLSVSVVETLRLSSRPEAADTFRAAPLATSADVFHGVRKAALVRVALPAGVAMVALIGFAVPGDARAWSRRCPWSWPSRRFHCSRESRDPTSLCRSRS